MTEVEWLTTQDAADMVAYLESAGLCDERLCRLTYLHCWDVSPNTGFPWVSSHAGNYADAIAFIEHGSRPPGGELGEWQLYTLHGAELLRRGFCTEPFVKLADVLRELWGNPFGGSAQAVEECMERSYGCYPVALMQVAQGIYDRRDWGLMPELGDLLEEAGCTDEEVLQHARGKRRVLRSREWLAVAGEDEFGLYNTGKVVPDLGWAEGVQHTRGCWLLDLILGKRDQT
jgi:hypothetical protein